MEERGLWTKKQIDRTKKKCQKAGIIDLMKKTGPEKSWENINKTHLLGILSKI